MIHQLKSFNLLICLLEFFVLVILLHGIFFSILFILTSTLNIFLFSSKTQRNNYSYLNI